MADPQFTRMLDRSITLYRGASTTVSAQSARLWFLTRPSQRVTAGGDVAEVSLILFGKSDLDVQRGDRFTVSSAWYEVVFVRPAQNSTYRAAECRAME